MKKRKGKGRILSVILTVCMLLGVLPAELIGGVSEVKAVDAGSARANTVTKTYEFNPMKLVKNEMLEATTFAKGTQKTGTDNYFSLLNTDSQAKIGAGGQTVDGIKYEYRYEFGGASKANGRRIRFETKDSAVVTVCAYSGTAGRSLYLDSEENALTLAAKNTAEVKSFTVAKGVHEFYVTEALYILYITVETDVLEYTVTVEDGKADKEKATEGETVKLEPEEGKEFASWSGTYNDGEKDVDITFDAEATEASNSFTMPAGDVSIKATYIVKERYTIEVNGGTATDADGAEITDATAGTEVTIKATPEDENQVFIEWEATGITLGDADKKASEFTFEMPEGAVSFKATYKSKDEVTTYQVNVTGGSANQTDAPEGAAITVTAEVPEG